MACDWFRKRSRLARVGMITCSCIPRARAASCWSWCRDSPETSHGFSRSITGRLARDQDRKLNQAKSEMLVLATDTSGRSGSIALARGDTNDSCEVIDVVPLAGGTFSAQLVPQIAALLAQ